MNMLRRAVLVCAALLSPFLAAPAHAAEGVRGPCDVPGFQAPRCELVAAVGAGGVGDPCSMGEFAEVVPPLPMAAGSASAALIAPDIAHDTADGIARTIPTAQEAKDLVLPARATGSSFNALLVLGAVSLVPAIMLMATSYLRCSIVLSFLRHGLGAQAVPPAQVVTILSACLTFIVMGPTLDRINERAITPYREGTITDARTLWTEASGPVRGFMLAQIDATGNWSSVETVWRARADAPANAPEPALIPTSVLVPAYMLSELRVAFLMGLQVLLPFLVVDLVVSAVLMSMGMVMLPPAVVSLPFKVLLFVMVDGWGLVVTGLVRSFAQPGVDERVSLVAGFARVS